MYFQYAVTFTNGNKEYMHFEDVHKLDLTTVTHIYLLDTQRGISTRVY